MDIYIDVLFMENLLINYLVLLITKKVLNKKVLSIKIFLSSIVGATYVVLMLLFPNVTAFYAVISKLLLSIFMVVIAFGLSNISDFFKSICIFYIVTFVLAGSMLFFIYLNRSEGIIRNGYMFWDSENSMLIMSVLTVLLALKVLWNYFRLRCIKEKLIIPVCINFDDKDINIKALLDTGANLNDLFSNLPILIVEFNSIKNLLPLEIQDIFNKSKSDDLDFITSIISKSEWFKKFRVIPFNSLGTKNGMLIGFKAKIKKANETAKVIVAIYNEFLTNNNSYEALIGLDLYNQLKWGSE